MNRHQTSPRPYVIGFVWSVILTTTAFSATELTHGNRLIAVLVGLALAQLVIQLVYFLHLGQERGAKWNTLVFGFMGMVVAILVFGSWWIMSHLNYNAMSSPQQRDHSIMTDEGIHK